MALIDVTDIVLDPDFQDAITIIRRTDTVNEYGENVITEASESVRAVIQPASPDDLQRLPDSVRRRDAVTVYYAGILTADAYPDVVVWGGDRYQVSNTEPFRNWGRGYTKAVCTLIEAAS